MPLIRNHYGCELARRSGVINCAEYVSRCLSADDILRSLFRNKSDMCMCAGECECLLCVAAFRVFGCARDRFVVDAKMFN